ncbi:MULTISPECIES: flagellar hook protein FlgE [Rahnella]|jgi:flagellar hook protein FlgE|uniref:Flagellar hook protein FlgE n=1 Tax=Rahnella victoriana TaxID=1510570 RepID=A0ABS0DQ88_9GAMM|nr:MULTISPECIES: flagellar hook protein FlgE [Rahnella]VTQ52796.1 flagellar hook protein FlgE [Campylobacter jejuni]MBF7955990.1 flagellar hook protein FlgE [Rahnella victoriana]PBI79411.1 flagellar hook protein FlgE [Rahnella victoriana]TBX31698.1 flagellar hook protein FlgE [Rahnella victoriana]TDS84343.1 flagellar hook protein FlgE [Rahnella sp. BIGb0236]
MSFSQAVSGLSAASTNLDVIGNNIANSATVGFKTATASFADMFAGSQTGMGVKVAAVTQNFNDGTTTSTSRGLDVALSGNGFFRLTDASGGVYYSRNGQFSLDENRNLVNTQGLSVTGYPATGTPPTIAAGAQPVALSIPTTMMSANATTVGTMVANLNSTDTAIPAATTFNPNDDTSYNYVSTITTYDSLGNSHDNSVYFAKTAANTWDVYSLDGSDATATAAKIGTLNFSTSGALTSTDDAAGNPTTTPLTLTLPMSTATNGAVDPQSVALNFTGSIQQSTGSDSIGSLTQDGYAAGQMTGYTINDDGTISGTYSNNKTQLLGQIVLSNFSNPEGLKSEGDNVWSATASSGQAVNGIAGEGGLASMTSGALESSNVDLSAELVNMIVAQRNYQSNAQTIKTQDSILNTLVNLR